MCCRCWRPSAVTSERGGRVSAVDWFHATAVYRARSSKESPRGVWSPRQCKEQTPWSRSKESQRRAADSQDNHAIMKRRLVGWALALGCLISTATPRETFLCIDEKLRFPCLINLTLLWSRKPGHDTTQVCTRRLPSFTVVQGQGSRRPQPLQSSWADYSSLHPWAQESRHQ